MFNMVKDILLDRRNDLFDVELIDYDEFLSILKRLKAG